MMITTNVVAAVMISALVAHYEVEDQHCPNQHDRQASSFGADQFTVCPVRDDPAHVVQDLKLAGVSYLCARIGRGGG